MPLPKGETLDLVEAQSAFGRLSNAAEDYARGRGWCIIRAEGHVALTDAADGDYDGPHKQGGQHYRKLAQDYDLFIDGKWLLVLIDGIPTEVYRGGRYVHKGASPEWREIGAFYEGLHPRCFWGGRIGDDNHLGFRWGGRA